MLRLPLLPWPRTGYCFQDTPILHRCQWSHQRQTSSRYRDLCPWFQASHAVVRTARMRFWLTKYTKLDANRVPVTIPSLRQAAIPHKFASIKPTEKDEFYFITQGSLIFYFYSAAEMTEKSFNKHTEYRRYFDGKRLLRAVENSRPLDDQVTGSSLQSNGSFGSEMTECAVKIVKKHVTPD